MRREVAHEGGDPIQNVANLVDAKTKVLVKLKQDVHKLADSELSQPTATPALTDQINDIKQQATNLLLKGGSDLVEGMQAVQDALLY